MYFLLRDCVEHQCIYRILVFDDNIEEKEIQDAIYDIKDKFEDEGNDNWTVNDVLNILSKNYSFKTESLFGDLIV